MSHGNWNEMFKAIQDNDIELVRFHIVNGVDINYQRPEYFTTPLIESIRLKHLLIAKLLLDYGASLDVREVYSKKNAMEVAKEMQFEEAIALFLNVLNERRS